MSLSWSIVLMPFDDLENHGFAGGKDVAARASYSSKRIDVVPEPCRIDADTPWGHNRTPDHTLHNEVVETGLGLAERSALSPCQAPLGRRALRAPCRNWGVDDLLDQVIVSRSFRKDFPGENFRCHAE